MSMEAYIRIGQRDGEKKRESGLPLSTSEDQGMIPCLTWPTVKYKVGQLIEFKHYYGQWQKAEIIGHDTEERVLVRYEIHSGIFAEDQSIHISRIRQS